METISARMFLLIGAVFFIAACTGYNASTSRDYRPQDGFYGKESLYQKTGEPSMLSGWRKQCDGATP
jgi:hypothetical protein